jgi:S1-C subfamily serine protease
MSKEVSFGILDLEQTPRSSWILKALDKFGSLSKAGVQAGDELCFIEGETLNSAEDFLAIGKRIGVGGTARVRLIRGGKKLEIPVKLRAKPKLELTLDEVSDVLERKIAP